MAWRRPAHFVLMPLMAPGHIIPMVEAARLLASGGAVVSLILTPVNASRIRPAMDLAGRDGLSIHFVELPFPCAEAGLPLGVESMDLVPGSLFPNFFAAIELFCSGPSLREYLQGQPPPSCLVCNICVPSAATDVARSLGIPWILFHGHSAFALLCYHNIHAAKLYQTVADHAEAFHVPGMPEDHPPVLVTRGKAPGFFNTPGWEKLREKITEAEADCHGVLVNSFAEMEGVYIRSYEAALGKPAWAVGPLSLCNSGSGGRGMGMGIGMALAARGSKDEEEQCMMQWLDGKEAASVVYVSFGSLTSTNPAQLVEIGEGLRAAGAPFVWVIKSSSSGSAAEKEKSSSSWVLSEFVERTAGAGEGGMVIEGWAPQASILGHVAVGGFVTHCGWNSVTEGVAAGVPMLTWPHFSDQFMNEMLVTDLLGIGVPVGIEGPISYVDDGSRVLVSRGEVEKGIRRLMSREGKRMRERANDLGKKAREAMEDEGGSSQSSLRSLIDCFTPSPSP